MTYALILIVAVKHSFVIDYNMSHDDCIALQSEWTATLDEHSYVVCEVEN